MPWLEDLKFPRGYQMGTHILYLRKKMYPLRIHLFIISISHANQL